MTTFNTHHTDVVHDAQLDYYGQRLATASSDRTVKIFAISKAADDAGSNAQGEPHQQQGPSEQTLLTELKAHEGPVWSCSWSHPTFGNLLATAGYDRKVIVWKEENGNIWTPVYESTCHESSVNQVAWAPVEFGLQLACASADGTVSILSWGYVHQRERPSLFFVFLARLCLSVLCACSC